MSNEYSVVPPPPEASSASTTEINIRTMTSDLALLGTTGGSAPQGERVSVSFTQHGKPGEKLGVTVQGPSGQAVISSAGSLRDNLLVWVVVGGVGLALLFLLGYFVVPAILSSEDGNGAEKPETSQKPSTPGTLPPSEAQTPLFLGHQSFFRSEPPQITVRLGGVRSVAELKTFGEQVAAEVEAVGPGERFFELVVKVGSNRQPAWSEFLTLINANLLTPEFFVSKFGQDFTAFVYRDATGIWPGYILKLNPGETALAVKSSVQVIERRLDDIANLFLSSPGTPASDFRDAQISGQPVRKISWSAPGTEFSYGWFYSDYLVMSTSEEGLRQALLNL